MKLIELTRRACRLRLLLALAVTLPAALCCIGAWFERGELIDWARGDALSGAALVSSHAAATLDLVENLVREMDKEVERLDIRGVADPADTITSSMQRLLTRTPSISAFLFRTRLGGGGDGSAQIESLSGSHCISRSGKQAVGSVRLRIARSGEEQGPTFSTCADPEFGDGTRPGVASAEVSPKYFERLWTKMELSRPGASIMLIGRDGEYLVRVPDRFSGSNLMSNSDARELIAAADTGRTVRNNTLDGIDRIHAVTRVEGYPVYAVYGLPISLVDAEWQRNTVILLAICGVVSAVLVTAILATRRTLISLAEEQASRLEAEAALHASQRFEVIGQMAASVAHDFANIVQAIGGGVRLMLKNASDPEQVTSLANMVADTAERGVMLTRRLLDFGRHGDGEKNGETAIPIEALNAVEQVLSHILDRQYSVSVIVDDTSSASEPIAAEQGRIENSLINLALNARDAMPDGGVITFTVGKPATRATLDGEAGFTTRLSIGTYIGISVSDAGCGMSAETLAQVAQPFFTTKARGKGTGLGLSSAKALVEQAGGSLQIKSASTVGTTVTMWFPQGIRPV